MTALPERRTRRTAVGAIVAVVLVMVAAGLAAAGAMTVANSKAGETVAGETRPVIAFPNTDNAGLAVLDDAGQLTALIVATVAPTGTGGSIVTIPVNADASVGLGEQRRPLDGELDAVIGDPERFFEAVEATLAISLQYGEIASAERLAELIGAVLPAPVNLSEPVIDSLAAGTGQVLPAGDTLLTEQTAIAALRAHDDSGESYDHHRLDVEIWSALAANAPAVDVVQPPLDEFERPVPSSTIDEVFGRLWSGPVQVRDVVVADAPSGIGGDSVIIDRHDSLLVFAQASPARVSTPNPGLVFRLVVPYSDEQILATEGLFGSRSELARGLIGELLFLSANVVSVDTTPQSSGAPARNLIEVADERFIGDIATLVPLVFGESDVVVAAELIDGVDVVMTLGEGYLDRKARQGDAEFDDEAETGDTVADDG